MKCSTIVTKVHKSATLAFNWLVEFVVMGLMVAAELSPIAQEMLPQSQYLFFIFFVTTINKLLRAKTNTALEDK